MLNIFFIGILVFLCLLAIIDLVVGASNDAVNFMSSAVGSKVASVKWIIAISAAGVFAGAAMSNGMMDVARFGVFSPRFFSFYDVLCIYLAVMIADVLLLDVFNSLGMPTSTTVSKVFELLGGAFIVALIKMLQGATDAGGNALNLGNLLNTNKALTMIMAIFISVAIAFVFGTVVMWLSRMLFSFAKPKNRSWKTILFSALAATVMVWFLIVKGLKDSFFMTPEVMSTINSRIWTILGVCFAAMALLMSLLTLLRVNVLKAVVLIGTFALAVAFAGNDLVNFVGVPFAGLDAFADFSANGSDPKTYMMLSLQESAQTPFYLLMLAGLIMVLALIFSKKAKQVVKMSVDLSRQDDGEEFFGSSAAARSIVRFSSRMANFVAPLIPQKVMQWIDARFTRPADADDGKVDSEAAFDLVRASVNVVLAGLLVALGTSLKLPLSTTYVTFMVAMGSSLADRAWSRESAVFRITGVLSVIGGWLITAGAAFFLCLVICAILYFGGYVAMVIAVVVALVVLIRSNRKFSEKKPSGDPLFKRMLQAKDSSELWSLLCEHIREGNAERLKAVVKTYNDATNSFLSEEYASLKKNMNFVKEELDNLKRQRRREIVALRQLDSALAIRCNTWYFLGSNSCQQMLYCIKRINDMMAEHVGNNFTPLSENYRKDVVEVHHQVSDIYERGLAMLEAGDFSGADSLRDEGKQLQRAIADRRDKILDSIHNEDANLNTLMLTVSILQESQELVGSLRRMARGMNRFASSAIANIEQ